MKLHYKAYGAGPPLIIMHGLFGSGDNWRTIARLMETDVRSIVVDMRNHGRSPHDPVMNFQVMSEDLVEFMDDLQLHTAAIMGHSMGGKVAMDFALAHPDRVESLMVVDIAPKIYPPHHERVIEAIESINTSVLGDRSEAEEVFHQILGPDQSTVQFLMKNLTRHHKGGFEWKANMPVIIASYRHMMQDVDSSMPFFGPTLFVRGARSRYILDEDMSRIRELFPSASLVTIPEAGHWVHADAPGRFVHEIRTFLQKR